jgi:iron complex outermembrane receptor protein
MFEKIVITARRKDLVEGLQSVPVSVSAFNSDQLDAMQFANIADVTANVPNADAEINSTYVGFVNFQIRGMGIRGSSLSNEPTVGVLIDGVYQGISAGILMDSLDM